MGAWRCISNDASASSRPESYRYRIGGSQLRLAIDKGRSAINR